MGVFVNRSSAAVAHKQHSMERTVTRQWKPASIRDGLLVAVVSALMRLFLVQVYAAGDFGGGWIRQA